MSSSAPFGTVFTPTMTVATATDGVFGASKLVPVEEIPLHPASHVLHYGSACFEGLKAHRKEIYDMMVTGVRDNLDSVPDQPGSLYLRPTLFGTLRNIGAAASPSSEAMLYVLLSPVGGEHVIKWLNSNQFGVPDEAIPILKKLRLSITMVYCVYWH